jgi:hypothetical protein
VLSLALRRAALVAGLALITALALVFAAAPRAQPGDHGARAGAPMKLGYWEARALGYDVGLTPAEAGMPVCPTKPDPGFRTAAEAERTMQRVDRLYGEEGPSPCLADPRPGVYLVGGNAHAVHFAPAASDYRYAGPVSTGLFEGVRSTIEVGNPSICHPCSGASKHFVARPLAITDNGNWLEAGWEEKSSLASDVYVYWTKSFQGYTEHAFTGSYPLVVGASYVFRVRQSGAPGETEIVAEIWYNGRWNTLRTQTGIKCQNADGSGHCYIESVSEAFASNQEFFDLNAPNGFGEGVDHDNVEVRVNPSDWRDFNNSNYGADVLSDSPYSVCWVDRWFKFRTPRGNC